MSQSVVVMNDKKYYAVVTPHKGVGEPKLILHEMDILENGAFGYGHKDCLVIDLENVKTYPVTNGQTLEVKE